MAKAWLLELVEARDLAAAGTIPVADLSRDAPPLCAALVAGLGSDAVLGSLRESAAGLSAMAGACDAAETVAAVEGLRRAAWSCLESELPRAAEAQATALALRLGHLAAMVAIAAVAAPDSGGRGAEPWVEAIERRLAGHAVDGRPFAVLIAEADDLEHLLDAREGTEVAQAIERVGRALREALRPQDELACERPGRYWITLPDAAAHTARPLAERLAGAIGSVASHHGAPLTISVGLAGCPEDSLSASGLAAHAEEGLFAARAAGVRVA